jgi:hypothetical protein
MIEEPNGIKCHFRLVPVRVRHPVPLSHYPVAIFTSGRELCLMPAFTNVHGYSGAPTTVFSVPCDRSAGGLAGNRIHPRLRAGFAMGYFSSVTRFSAWQKRKRPGSHMGSGLFWLYLGVQGQLFGLAIGLPAPSIVSNQSLPLKSFWSGFVIGN